MNEALQKLEALLANAAAVTPRFAPNSRYNGVATLELKRGDARTVAYVARRFIGAFESLVVVQEHAVVQGDRLDLLAAQILGDAEQWWKIADANPTLRPEELTAAPGRIVRIAAPAGFDGGTGTP
jgi:nucleoid-associated protein YgaU